MRIRLLSFKRWIRRYRSLGARGERAAARYLKRHGYKILARNLRNHSGEIDLVAQDKTTQQIAVVEVKSASSDTPPPERHVNYTKQRKLITLAKQMIKRHNLQDCSVRFDVIGIVWPANQKRPTRITHHIDAFRS